MGGSPQFGDRAVEDDPFQTSGWGVTSFVTSLDAGTSGISWIETPEVPVF